MFQFKKHDENKIKDKERLFKEAKEDYDSCVGAAQNCLNSEEFKKYREEYERLEKIIIEELILIDQTEGDPVRYGFACKDVVSKLRHIGVLLRGVNGDAGKKITY